jgi:4'-phosphopantetheinyl transferase
MRNFEKQWRNPPNKLSLKQNEIHVWRADLNVSQHLLNTLEDTLEKKERDRANRFHFEQDRHHFIAARGILRVILGRYLNLGPKRLKFIYTPHGKPSILNETDYGYLKFNLSHSHGFALYAVTIGREVGIDIERVRANLSFEKIAKRFFSPLEFETLVSLPPSERIQGFFNCWTRKEAYIKAVGEGLSIPLDQFDVTLRPSDEAKIISIKGDAALASNWSLHSLTPAPGYVGALAVEGKNLRIKYWVWSG